MISSACFAVHLLAFLLSLACTEMLPACAQAVCLAVLKLLFVVLCVFIALLCCNLLDTGTEGTIGHVMWHTYWYSQ
jgi:hypothetical protein